MATNTHQIPELDAKGLREFALVTSGVVAGLFGLFFPWVFERALPVWPFIMFAVLGLWGLVAPMSLRPVYRGWMKFGLILSRITTPIIMGLVFYVVITPGAIFWKITGKDGMARKFDDSESYRVPSRKAPPENLERPY